MYDEYECIGVCIIFVMNVCGSYFDECIMKCVNGELFWCYVIGCVLDCVKLLGEGIWIFEDLLVYCLVMVVFMLCECDIVV